MPRPSTGTAALAAAVVAAAAGLALRRALRTLDDADRRLGLDQSSFTFPPGRRTEVTTSDGSTIAVEITGTGPVVALVHGITSSRQDWGPVAGLLVERGHTVIGIDQRGHGQSTTGSDGYGADRLGRDLAEILVGLDLEDVVLVGHSMGGIAAMTLAIDHPEACSRRVRSLVLVATTAKTPRLFRRPVPRLVEAVLGQARYELAVRRPAVATTLFGRFGSTGLIGAARASALRADPRVVAECAADLAGYDIRARLGSIAVTTHCIFGTRDVVTSPDANRLIARSIPGATATELPGAGHLLIWTHGPEIVERISGATQRRVGSGRDAP